MPPLFTRAGVVLLAAAGTALALPQVLDPQPSNGSAYEGNPSCRRVQVAVLGAGVAGIIAARTLTEEGIDDFVIVEYNEQIGGRVRNRPFGQTFDGSNGTYAVELGANWVQGLGSPGGPQNPIWELAQQYELINTYSNFSSLQTFNETGPVEYNGYFEEFEEAYARYERDAGTILLENLQDRSARTGFSVADWKVRRNPQRNAVEWFSMDFEYAQPPEETSHEFSAVNFNTSFYLWSEENNFVHDPRGFRTFIVGEANSFLEPNDPRLLLNTVVANVSYSDRGVDVYNTDGSCISADYALCTFSLGVLQQDVVEWSPALPLWKQTAIESMTMGTYTKIFMQFRPEDVFWDTDTQFFLYADPVERGYYPLFQTLDTPGFEPGSGILFVTVVDTQSFVVEAQDDETTLAQIMAVLRSMFGEDAVPDPVDFFYPRWSAEPWAYGSYSNWPPSLTLEMHQNLRANVDRVWFAGEATHPQFFGFLQGAYYEGQQAGRDIAACLLDGERCRREMRYEVLRGTTDSYEYTDLNGWSADNFATYGIDNGDEEEQQQQGPDSGAPPGGRKYKKAKRSL